MSAINRVRAAAARGRAEVGNLSGKSDDLSAADFRRLIDAARWAPSPDNNQPWAFRQIDQGLEVFHVRDRAVRSDVNDLFSWLAVGSAIENLALEASSLGWVADVDLAPPTEATTCSDERVAVVHLRPGAAADSLQQQIRNRVTNRRAFDRTPLDANLLNKLASQIHAPNQSVLWLTGRPEKKQAARLVRLADRIRFERRSFHEELYDVIRFSEAEARETADGMSIASLEIPGPMVPVIRFLKPWSRMSLMNRLGASRLFAGVAAQQVPASGAVALLYSESDDARSCLNAGRSMQRLWLAATAEGLAVQPLGSVPLFLAAWRKRPDTFSPAHLRHLQRVAEEFKRLFPGAEGRMPVMLLRLGRAPAPSARSCRYDLSRLIIEG